MASEGIKEDLRRFGEYVEYIRDRLQYDEEGRAWAPYEMDWDYQGVGYFAAPWYSGMAQGAIASMFVRAHSIGLRGIDDRLLLAVGRTLAEPSEKRIVKSSPCEHWIEEYPAAVSEDGEDRWSHVINGAMWGLVGFHEVALALGRADWMETVRLAVATLSASLTRYDTDFGPSYGLVPQTDAPIVLYFDAPMADSSATFRIDSLRLSDQGGRQLTAEAGRLCKDGSSGKASILLRAESSGLSIRGVQIFPAPSGQSIELYPATKEVDGVAFLATPPKWDYAWGPATHSADGVTSRDLLADGRPAVIVIPDAPSDTTMTIHWIGSTGSSATVEYRGNCSSVLGSLVGDGSGHWHKTEYTIPGSAATMRVEPYLGFRSIRRPDGRASWSVQLDRPADVWEGGWVRLFPGALREISEQETLKLEVTYSGSWNGPLFARIWNGDGHILAAFQGSEENRVLIEVPGALLHRHLGTYVKNALVYAGLKYFGDVLGCRSCALRRADWTAKQQFSYDSRDLLLWADAVTQWTGATVEYCVHGRCERSSMNQWG